MRTLHFTDRELGRLENVVQREFNRKGERIITKLKLKDFEKLDVTEVKK